MGPLRDITTANPRVHGAVSPQSRMAPQLLEEVVVIDNQDKDLGTFELGDEDLIDEEDLLADSGDLDFDPETDSQSAAMTRLTASTMAAAEMPSFSSTSSPGADAPNRSMPIAIPRSPIHSRQPMVTPASIDTRRY